MSYLYADTGHYWDDNLPLPQLLEQVYGPYAHVQYDMHGGAIVTGPEGRRGRLFAFTETAVSQT